MSHIKTEVNEYIKFLLIILVFAVVIIFFVFGFYFLHFNEGVSSDPNVWGTFGDFIGGTLNPVLSFLSLIALLFTIVLQQKELGYSRKELEYTRKELERSAKAQEATKKNS